MPRSSSKVARHMAKETIVLLSLPRQAAPLPRGPQQARMVGVGRGHRRGTMDMVGGNHTGGRRQVRHPLPTRPGPQCRQPSHGQVGPLQRLPAVNGHLLKGPRCHHQDCALKGAAAFWNRYGSQRDRLEFQQVQTSLLGKKKVHIIATLLESVRFCFSTWFLLYTFLCVFRSRSIVCTSCFQ